MNKIQIKLKIGGRNYPLTIEAQDEELIRKIAKVLNEKIVYYKNLYASADAHDSLVMASIDTVVTLSKESGGLPSAAEEHLKQIEQLLS